MHVLYAFTVSIRNGRVVDVRAVGRRRTPRTMLAARVHCSPVPLSSHPWMNACIFATYAVRQHHVWNKYIIQCGLNFTFPCVSTLSEVYWNLKTGWPLVRRKWRSHRTRDRSVKVTWISWRVLNNGICCNFHYLDQSGDLPGLTDILSLNFNVLTSGYAVPGVQSASLIMTSLMTS